MQRAAFLVAALLAAPALAGVRWIPIAAHSGGVGGSAWRTDVTLHNPCPDPAAVEVILHGSGDDYSLSLSLPPGSSTLLDDVVARITGGDGAGSLEIVSDRELSVRSRTFNAAADGTYGQSLDGIGENDGIDFGRSAVVAGLREDAAFRSNLGVLNMGRDLAALVRVELFTGSGEAVGSFELEVPPERVVQENRPFRNRFGRSTVGDGFARVTVLRGTDVYVYGSIVDNATGDPTTSVMDAGTVQALSAGSRQLAELALLEESVPAGAEIWILPGLDPGSVIREAGQGDDGGRVDVPTGGGTWALVVVDLDPTAKWGHPLRWLLVDTSANAVVDALDAGNPPTVEPPARQPEPFLTTVQLGTVEGRTVRALAGDGVPPQVDHTHKSPYQGLAFPAAGSTLGRSPVRQAIVIDGGGEGGKWMYGNDALGMASWLRSNGFTVQHFSQYLGAKGSYFETPIQVRRAIEAVGQNLASRGGPPDGGECDSFFFYVSAHGSYRNDRNKNMVILPSVDLYSVESPENQVELRYATILDALLAFPSWAKVTIFVDACYSGQILQAPELRSRVKDLCTKLCGLTIITTADAVSTTAASSFFLDSSTEDFLDEGSTDRDGDGNVGDIRDRFQEMADEKDVGNVLSFHCPECRTWCVLDGPEGEKKSACAPSSGSYSVSVTDVIDPAGHDEFDGDPLAGPLEFALACPATTVTGPTPFVPVSGPSTAEGDGTCSFVARGRGTVAGFPDIAVAMDAVVDPSSATITGRYSLGVEGGLPEGQPITYVFEATPLAAAPGRTP